MKMGERLLKHLDKRYEPSTLITFRFGRYDVATKTDEEGNPFLVFIGQADERGIIKGDKFDRQLIKDDNGSVIRSHWDYKGKV
jgi:hypothetical protein